jgi:hypothetical protein
MMTLLQNLNNYFPQYFAVTSHCIRCQQTFVHPSEFFNLGMSKKSQGAKSGEKGGWSIFVKDFFSQVADVLSDHLSKIPGTTLRNVFSLPNVP